MGDPLSTQPEDDSGAVTQDRFSWQHHCIAVDCVGLIVGNQARRVICEIHEDYVVEHRGGLCELVSCKHREASRGPWKLVDLCVDGGVGHLFGRWSAFPETLLRLMTNGGLAAGKADAAAVAVACSKAADGVQFHDGADVAMCRDALAGALIVARNRKAFAGIPIVAGVSAGRAVAQPRIPAEFLARVEMFMRALRICSDLPDRRFAGPVHAYQVMRPCLEKLGFNPAHAPTSYAQLMELIHRKNTASPWTEAYGERVWSRHGATASGQYSAVVAARTIVADDVLRVIQTSLPRSGGTGVTDTGPVAVDPSDVSSPTDLARRLNALRETLGLSLRDLEDRDRAVQAAGNSAPMLTRANLNIALNEHRLPSEGFVRAYLDCCEVSAADQAVWLGAWRRARTRLADAVVVREASPLALGVQVAGNGDAGADTLVPYVPRDRDEVVRAALKTTGCFLVLVGSSSVGKTRTLYEAVRRVAPDWTVVRPDDVEDIFRLAAERPDRTVVWLDELQRYLGGQRHLSSGVISRLVTAGIMVLATIWTSEYNALLTPAIGGDDQLRGAQEVLLLAEVVQIDQALTPDERERAVELAAGDARLARALRATDYTFVQMLVGGPALVRWWTDLSDPYARAMIEAAVDARRVGVQLPLGATILTEAMHDYLHPLDRMSDPTTWLDRALAEATAPLAGAVAPVRRVGEPSAGPADGVVVADFLLQHIVQVRRVICPPHSLWNSLVSHLLDSADIRRVAASARNRMRYRYSEPLLRQLIAGGEGPAAIELADIFFSHDRVDDAIVLLQDHDARHPHDETVRRHLAHLGVLRRRITELRQAGDATGREMLADILADRGRTEALRLAANAGDPAAQDELAQLLADRGQTHELDARARSGDTFAADRRAALLARAEELDALRALADGGDEAGSFQLARLLARHRLMDELAQRAEKGDRFALNRLTAVAGSVSLPVPADDLTVDQPTKIAHLRTQVAAGSGSLTSERLTRLLLELRLAPGLWEEMEAGTPFAAERLISVLMAQGTSSVHLLRRLRTYGLNSDGSIAGPEDRA
ncbi:hypothetical protein ACPZ19_50810 [Amycolatopsis lurida]